METCKPYKTYNDIKIFYFNTTTVTSLLLLCTYPNQAYITQIDRLSINKWWHGNYHISHFTMPFCWNKSGAIVRLVGNIFFRNRMHPNILLRIIYIYYFYLFIKLIFNFIFVMLNYFKYLIFTSKPINIIIYCATIYKNNIIFFFTTNENLNH